MQITIHSNIGRKRSSNQDYADYFYSQSQQVLFILCDGVGGNLAGDIASQRTTEYIGKEFEKVSQPMTVTQAHAWMVQMTNQVNNYILNQADLNPEYEGMGTTIVLATIVEDTILICHVGDSRAYAFAKGQLTQLTEDHSLVNELIRTGEITFEESIDHPHRNVVTQSIGTPMVIEPEFSEIALDRVEILLLCSDGLNGMIRNEEIEQIMAKQPDLDRLGQQLVEAANEAGGLDNITIILATNFNLNDEGGDIIHGNRG
ncbi:Stp1/IreP family PP2C-type Ser/Thr phosphatase [Facklamia miroungae]|uniref:Protein phosphatase n=1 Tax=Facklamia miroungae TaxID=120956 RepID=A0A1G7PRA5_9LACT|nr:Stp1/IreP family PP2C-type Ser/Thr phosphatase [Facklamia miroungae]NKZ28799.1 Stp1/IreP family PP2C-type Ser/Thr phosphatase [Facklamia miroungae]SDF88754.1 protein phosphatase [Facklamia miroungae]